MLGVGCGLLDKVYYMRGDKSEETFVEIRRLAACGVFELVGFSVAG